MKSVLFVDDESRILDGIRRMLYAERKRWDMEFALGGEAALVAFQSKSFDIVVSDMRMPGMDGAALLSKVREISPITVRIILSGHTELEAAMRAIPVAHSFLAKPCNASALRETLERVCGLQDLLTNAEVRRVISGIGELPSVPGTYQELIEAVAEPASTIDGIAKIVGRDVAMSAKVLQFANNAFFGASQTVNTVAGAVGYLGIETIKNLLLKGKTFRVLDPTDGIPPSTWDHLQAHALGAATIMASLPLEESLKDSALLAGLLHDIGELILSTTMPEVFATILAKAAERKCKSFIIEEELLGISHAEIGAYLLGIWGLPYSIVDAVAHHHHPTRVAHSGFDLVTAIYVADLLAHESPGGPIKPLPESDLACIEELGIADKFAEWRKSRQSQMAATAGT
jgi:HD-like signal output (HDOD) protein/CheY-like chemotaxis protein